jgi:hypothetical protein
MKAKFLISMFRERLQTCLLDYLAQILRGLLFVKGDCRTGSYSTTFPFPSINRHRTVTQEEEEEG